MGLDMYLYKKHYVKNWDHAPERKHQVSVKLNGKKHPAINPRKVEYIQEEVGYWRKANQIHQWFVDHVQNGVDECQESYVDLEKLKELHQSCLTILASEKTEDCVVNVQLAKDLLPNQSGFFFGGTEYDEYYVKELKDTVKMLEKEFEKITELEANSPFHVPEYYYRASW